MQELKWSTSLSMFPKKETIRGGTVYDARGEMQAISICPECGSELEIDYPDGYWVLNCPGCDYFEMAE